MFSGGNEEGLYRMKLGQQALCQVSVVTHHVLSHLSQGEAEAVSQRHLHRKQGR